MKPFEKNVRGSARTLSVFSVLALTVALVAGCSSGTSSTAQSSNSAVGKKVVYLTPRSFNAFHFTLACDIGSDAKKAGLDLSYVDAKLSDFSVQGFTTLLQTAMASQPDGVITTTADATALDPVFQQIKSSGAKLVMYDNTLADESIPDAQVATDVKGVGAQAADAIAKAAGEKGKLLVVDLAPGIPSTNQRAEGFINQVKAKYPNMEVLPTQYDNQDSAKSAQIVTATLASHPDLAGIFFTYSGAAIGAMPALISAGAAGKVAVASTDSDPALVDYLKKGYISALFPHNVPKFAQEVVDRMVSALEGKKIDPKTLLLPAVMVTKTNVDDPSISASLYRTKC